MARRTVNEPALADMADELQRFAVVMQQCLQDAEAELRGLHRSWGGVAYAAFAQRLVYWKEWAEELGEEAGRMQRNAHITHRNYSHNNEVNTAMWGGA